MQRQRAVTTAYSLLIAVALLMGSLVPNFYEWTGSDQSRLSPLVGQTACGMVVVGIVVWLILPWLSLGGEEKNSKQPLRFRFTSRTMLMTIAAFAIFVVATMSFPIVVSGAFCAFASFYVVWFWSRSRHDRWPTTALLACMCFPFLWIFFYDELGNLLPEILWIAAGMPGFFLAAAIGSVFGQSMNDLVWLGLLLTGGELIIGIWIIRLGPRSTIAYLVFVLIVSTFGSFIVNALVRA